MNEESQHNSNARLKDLAKSSLRGHYVLFIGTLLLYVLFSLFSRAFVGFVMGILCGIAALIGNFSGKLSNAELAAFLSSSSVPTSPIMTTIDYTVNFLTAILIDGVLIAGVYYLSLNIACRRSPRPGMLFDGFRSRTSKVVVISFAYALAAQLYQLPMNYLIYQVRQLAPIRTILIASGLLVIGFVVNLPVSLCISQAYYLLYDFPSYTALELLRASIKIMQHNKMRLFSLQVSFVPHCALGVLSLGIGFLWLIPYMFTTYTHFYLDLIQAQRNRVGIAP